MAKGAYVGINGVAHKIKGGYVGVSDTAQKIKKAYVGIGGVARPCWGGEGKPEYYGVVSKLTYSRNSPGGGFVGDYCVIAGGYAPGSHTNCVTYVEAYSSNLTHSVLDPLTTAMAPTSSTVGDYLLMTGVNATSVMQTYSRQLVRGTAPSLSVVRNYAAGVRHANYALFAGGYNGTILNMKDTGYIDAYSASLVRNSLAKLPNPPGFLNSTTGDIIGDGGALTYSSFESNSAPTLLMYDATLVRATRSNPFTPARAAAVAARTTNHIIFSGSADLTYDSAKNLASEALDEKFVLHAIEPLTPPAEVTSNPSTPGAGRNWAFIVIGFYGDSGYISCLENLYSRELVHSAMSDLTVDHIPNLVRSNEKLILCVGVNNEVVAYKIS